MSGVGSISDTIVFSNANTEDNKSSCSNYVIIERQNRNLKKTYAKPQIIQQCLSTLDIFKSLMEDADQMKNKIIRDVTKSIYISSFNEGDIIYDIQDQSNQIFLIFQGSVSFNIKKIVYPQQSTPNTGQNVQKQEQIIYQQVQTFQKGQGFGQAQFIRGRKRDFQACVKKNQSIVGRLRVQSFQEVVQNYKLRVYYKKLEMFKKCPLLSNISGNRLQFIVNSSKPILLGMSKTLIKENQYPKNLYLVSKGQLQVVKNDQKNKYNLSPLGGWKSKKISKYFLNPHESKQKIQMRKITEGEFIGDIQIALNRPFRYQVKTSSQKVYLYSCDIRLILSQIPIQDLQNSKIFYNSRLNHHKNQLKGIKQARRVATEKSQISKTVLTPDQIKIKKQIRKRYLDTVPFSLVDQSSPLEISKMLERKCSRFKTQAYQPIQKFPVLELFAKKPFNGKKYKKSQLQKEQSVRNYSLYSQNVSPSHSKQKIQKIHSQREMTNKNQTEQKRKIERKANKQYIQYSIQKRKISLPPILCFSTSNNKSPIKKQRILQRLDKFIPKNQQQKAIQHRINEFIYKIQLCQSQKQQK